MKLMKRIPFGHLALPLLIASATWAAGQAPRAVQVGNPGNGGPTDSGAAASITRDGRFLVYLSGTDLRGRPLPRPAIFVQNRQNRFTEMVSVSDTGEAANDYCTSPSISQDGRYVAFLTRADNLVAGDTNNVPDVFVRDRTTGHTQRISVSANGEQSGTGNFLPNVCMLSGNGRYVVFTSYAQLVSEDHESEMDVFVRDLVAGSTERVSVGLAGAEASNASFGGSISDDGRYVCFDSFASNLVEGDTDQLDVFVRDRLLGTTRCVSVSPAGSAGDNRSLQGTISADGRFVAFTSLASNLVPNDTNDAHDVFVRDLTEETTERVSVSSSGEQGDSESGYEFFGSNVPNRLSEDGRFVLFTTLSTNLIPHDRPQVQELLLHDRATHLTQPAWLANGKPIPGGLQNAMIAGYGRYLLLNTQLTAAERKNHLAPLYLIDRQDPGSGKIQVKVGNWKTGAVGTPVPGMLRVTNQGKGSLTFTLGEVTGPFTLTGPAGPFTLAPRGSRQFELVFLAPEAGKYDGGITLQSDDPRHSTLAVRLRAKAR
jgi:Tol biopolymer transport system component